MIGIAAGRRLPRKAGRQLSLTPSSPNRSERQSLGGVKKPTRSARSAAKRRRPFSELHKFMQTSRTAKPATAETVNGLRNFEQLFAGLINFQITPPQTKTQARFQIILTRSAALEDALAAVAGCRS
jgi:hypothetical protein